MPEKNYQDLEKEITSLKNELEAFGTFKKQLRSKLDFFNLLFETLSNPIFVKDKKGLYLTCNTAFEKFTGKKRNQIIGKTVYDMGPKEIADTYKQMDDQLFEQGGTQQYEWKVKNKNGQLRDVIFDKAVFCDEEKNIAGLIGVITDITPRTKAEAAIKASEEKFKKISAMANDAIIRMDQEGKIVYWNKAARTIFGYTAKEAIGKDLHQLLVPEKYLLAFEGGFKNFKKDGKGPAIGKTLELSAIKKGGIEFEVELSLSSFQAGGHWNAVGIVRDISSRKKNEREREHLIKNLEQALNEIKTLRGIVPICASCKKIRDDKGFWKHVETYVQEHSHAQFSHGICPDCRKTLYPDYPETAG